MKHCLLTISLLLIFNLLCISQNDSTLNEPIYFLDSIRVSSSLLFPYDPNEIAAVSILRDTSAKKIMGDEGKNGIIYITSKKYAKEKYWKFFTSKSPDYVKVVPSLDKEFNVVYILNTQILEIESVGDLFNIDNDNFIDLKVIDKKKLRKDFKVKDKDWGIVIRTKPIDNN